MQILCRCAERQPVIVMRDRLLSVRQDFIKGSLSGVLRDVYRLFHEPLLQRGDRFPVFRRHHPRLWGGCFASLDHSLADVLTDLVEPSARLVVEQAFRGSLHGVASGSVPHMLRSLSVQPLGGGTANSSFRLGRKRKADLEQVSRFTGPSQRLSSAAREAGDQHGRVSGNLSGKATSEVPPSIFLASHSVLAKEIASTDSVFVRKRREQLVEWILPCNNISHHRPWGIQCVANTGKRRQNSTTDLGKDR